MISTSSALPGKVDGCFALRNSNEEYHADRDSLSSSGIKRLLRSPAHYLESVTSPKTETDAMALGTALHTLILEPAEFDVRYAIYRGTGRKDSKDYLAFAAAQPADTKILKEKDVDWLFGMRDAIYGYRRVSLQSKFDQATKELSIYWVDEETGVQFRIRPDAFLAGVTLDLKKTTDARPWKFETSCYDYGYDIQAALYTDGVYRYTGQRVPFVFIAVEDDAPHGVWLYEASDEMIAKGAEKVRRGAELFAECRRNNEWPSYEGYSSVDIPRWAADRD